MARCACRSFRSNAPRARPSRSTLRLIDIAGRRIYSPGMTSNNWTTPVGQRLTCYAVFGAPPPSTKTMTVQFYEKFDLINGAPIGE